MAAPRIDGPGEHPRLREPGEHPKADRAMIEALRGALKRAAEPKRAPAMQSYIKTDMPFYGVATPVMRQVCRMVFTDYPVEGFAAWRDTSLLMFRGARRYEELHAAIHLAGLPRYQDHLAAKALPLLEEFIVTGAWWDIVDTVAVNHLALVLQRDPAKVVPRMRTWAGSRSLWKRRAVLLCQVKFREQTDLELLFGAIEESMESSEFFLRKAIGWALREHARTDPQTVISFVERHRDRLSPLSKKEALRHLVAAGRLASIP